jgi:DNA-binding transcriptional regulator YdaS (Cro superfamily)
MQPWAMATFRDFADWAGGQTKAARLIGINKARAHRLTHGAAIKPEEAMAIELASGGVFRKEQLVFGPLVKNHNTMG